MFLVQKRISKFFAYCFEKDDFKRFNSLLQDRPNNKYYLFCCHIKND